MGTNILTIVGLLIGVIGFFSPWLYESLDAFQFHRKKGRRIAGDYYSVFSNPACRDKPIPVTHEVGKITQRGAKIRYTCRENDYDFQYEMNGTIHDEIIVGYWFSKVPRERVHGSAYLYITPRGDLVGIWAGDAKPHQKTFGYWALSTRKEFLECFVSKMESVAGFKMIDILTCVDVFESDVQMHTLGHPLVLTAKTPDTDLSEPADIASSRPLR